MNYSNNQVINLEVRTLSPVSILDEEGKKLNPHIDAILDKENIIELDMDKVTSLIINDNRALNIYLEILRNKKPNSKFNYNIKQFLKHKGISIDEVAYRRIPCKSCINNLIEVATCIKSVGRAYIPGSSIKGAIRTSILYNNVEGDSIMSNIKSNYRDSKRNNEYVGQDVFRDGIGNIQSDIFKYLIVRDANKEEDVSLAIYEARSINLYKNKNYVDMHFDMRALLECIDINEKFNLDIIIKNNAFKKEKIFDYINNFYEKVINKEIEEISKMRTDDKNKIINEYNLLLEKIRINRKNKDGFIMRLGKLKGYFSNTLTAELDDDSLLAIVDNYKIKKRDNFGEFPTTKWVICDNENIKGTFGWVEVKEK